MSPRSADDLALVGGPDYLSRADLWNAAGDAARKIRAIAGETRRVVVVHLPNFTSWMVRSRGCQRPPGRPVRSHGALLQTRLPRSPAPDRRRNPPRHRPYRSLRRRRHSHLRCLHLLIGTVIAQVPTTDEPSTGGLAGSDISRTTSLLVAASGSETSIDSGSWLLTTVSTK